MNYSNTSFAKVFFYIENMGIDVQINGEWYPPFFNVWKYENSHLIKHICNKWDQNVGSRGQQFWEFFKDLDETNRDKVLNYIEENYGK